MQAYKLISIMGCAWLAGLVSAYIWQYTPSLSHAETVVHNVPHHMAIIMDGNRRWARERGLSPWIGHERGIQPLKDVIAYCIEHGIAHLSVYAFSQENFKRPEDEKNYLFNVISQQLTQTELPELQRQGVRINILGDTRLFPETLIDDIQHVQDATRDNTKLTLNILFCYAGRSDIAQATQKISADYAHGTISYDEITPDRISSYLYTKDIPDPDLIIRTGGRHRISNFLLYQMAYSEIYFLPIYWPDVTRTDIHDIIVSFSNTSRTFGS